MVKKEWKSGRGMEDRKKIDERGTIGRRQVEEE